MTQAMYAHMNNKKINKNKNKKNLPQSLGKFKLLFLHKASQIWPLPL
jgi:hypothetical protein